ncbi:MAG: MMPL family transporter [Candidatus Dormibacteria bacterium]
MPDSHGTVRLGPVGRLGRHAAMNPRRVFLGWAVSLLALGILAPRVESALSGAGWEASGSQSVQARDAIAQAFGGQSSAALIAVVHSDSHRVGDPAFDATVVAVATTMKSNPAVSGVLLPAPGASISRDGHTAVIQAGAARDTAAMVAAADDLKGRLASVASAGVTVALTGSSGLWSDFNEANRTAMLRSEVLSWPVTVAILVVAFGSLVAAGLPLLLTIAGLVAAAGSLFLASLVGEVSIWAMNFALMFALALGIDDALFIVVRFRAALHQGADAVEAVGTAMDTAGKAVLFSGLTVLVSLTAVIIVPSPAFRTMSLGIMLAVLFVLLATLTLLPAVLGRLGRGVDRLSLPWASSGDHRSACFAAWGERLWRQPVRFGLVAVGVLGLLALPILGLRTGMPSISVVPSDAASRLGYDQVTAAFGPGAPGIIQVIAPAAQSGPVGQILAADRGIAAVLPTARSADGALVLLQAHPTAGPSDPAVGATIDRLRAQFPSGVLVGGAVAENHDLEVLLVNRTPLVIGVVLVLGFLLLLVAVRAPLVAAVGVLSNLLAAGAAFGVARLIFQEGHLSSFLGFEPQGFLDAWAPVFFFAMVFAISMDYTVFLLASAREHWEQSHDAHDAAVGGLAHSGRVIFAAAGVMVAVFLTFALSGPLPPKEMGIVLGVAVLLDAALVRLLVLPVALRLLGDAAWWLPRWASGMLPTVRFAH